MVFGTSSLKYSDACTQDHELPFYGIIVSSVKQQAAARGGEMSKVVQSLSHGRSRTVEVERVIEKETKSGRPVLHLPKRKRKKKKKVELTTSVKPAKGRDAEAAQKKQKKPTRQKTKPTFSKSISRSSRIPELESHTGEVGRRRRGRSSNWRNPTTLSAGMPGNEEVDPTVW
jgi:hypothetical protein